MWSTECERTADLPVETLWDTWIKVLAGEIELPEGDRYKPLEPVGLGARVTMTPAGQDSVDIVITRWEPPHVQADRASYGGMELTFTHSFMPAETRGESVVITRLDIDGPGADDAGPVVGPQIAKDFPQAIDSLIEAARVAM
ncbi:hypothetical protein E4J66_00025 [Actinomyces viscosus]|uniref:Polyketide cyclase / dehydrase and lipid transport n=1 Tax=Actinomyces viscosus TaxID=1656 RepID=A0A448PJG4_ACTVI|nr:hypothetical protein [Actinomyces viscosus]TFH54042.1 hypothetical protein E4J66_00025 [Actinomyces viscosus]VEI15133.1 Uncharacterised protein [Actinomyces viscosus]